jgi:lysozyme
MQTSPNGIHLIEYFEGFVPHIYRDAVGVATIGYGTTSADFNPLPTSCTRAQAEGWLISKLHSKYEPAINRLGVPLNRNQFDALASLAYNCGPGAMQWQIGIDLRARRYGAAANDFMRYVYAGGRVLGGLVTRRHMEQTLFLKPVVAAPPADVFAIHPKGVLPGIKVDEHATMVSCQGAFWHYKQYRNFLKGIMYPRLRACRDRCWRIAKYEPPNYTRLRPHAVWADDRHLGARWQALNTFMKRIDAIP